MNDCGGFYQVESSPNQLCHISMGWYGVYEHKIKNIKINQLIIRKQIFITLLII